MTCCIVPLAEAYAHKRSLTPPLSIQTPILNRLRDMLGLDLFATREIADRSGDFDGLAISFNAMLQRKGAYSL